MYVDKARAYLPEGGELHGHIAHEGAALASRRDDAAYGAGRFEVEIGVGEELFQPVAFDVEGGFDDAVARRILNGGTLVPSSSPSAPSRIDLPAPVSPVMILSPRSQSISKRSISR